MKKVYSFLVTAMLILLSGAVFSQGTTTSGMNGRVTDVDGQPLTGATVIAIEESTNSNYGTISDDEGYYQLPLMNAGGPYTLSVTFVGFQEYHKAGIYLTLGQTLRTNVKLSETATELTGVEIIGVRNDIFDGNRTGAETVVTRNEIEQMPTLGRTLSDYVRLTPQATSTAGGGMSIAGANNRYNAISIDGAVNNDVFGLSATGTNGGQTGGTAVSLDAIEQFQVQIAPYDVRQSGFNGASINAVTKRGTNSWGGTAYFFMQNEKLAGKTPWDIVKDTEDPDSEREKLAEFDDYIYGLSIGGPLVKDKVFFFLNTEFQNRKTPQPYNFEEEYDGDSDKETIQGISEMVNSRFGYNTGGFGDVIDELKGIKILARIDWNIGKNHKLMLRHSYVKNEAIQPYTSSNRRLYFYNSGRTFPSITNSTALELKSHWSNFSNNLVIGFTGVRDDRNPLGANFPTIVIDDGSADIYLGSEPYSTANKLDQDILTINDNFNIYKGAHTITVGVNFEYYNTYNLFMRKNFGEYKYNSVDDFMMAGLGEAGGEIPAYQYDRNYSLVDDITGDGSAAAAEFKVFQFGIYAQDEWQANEKFKLTVGIRLDIPMFLDDPTEAPGFNDTVVPKIDGTYDPVSGANYNMAGAQSGKMPKSQFMWSPRIGFNWDVSGDQTTQVRGGVGLFTSRLPLVWPGGSYTNNAMTVGGVYHRSSWGDPIYFRSDWNNQYTYTDFNPGEEPKPAGQMDLFVEDFKFPQILRASLAVDQKLPWGMVGTLEGIFTKTINNIIYYNYNVAPSDKNLTGGPDNRPIYSGDPVEEDRYTRIMVGDNTNDGYTYNLTAQVQKSFDNGFQGSVSYTFGRAMALNDATSSQNSSQWRYMENVNGRNHLDLSYSDFDLGSRVVVFLGYKKEYAKHFATGISLFYDGISGNRYSYSYDNSRVINYEDSQDESLIWIPGSRSEINLVDIMDGEVVEVSADEQWNALEKFIENDPYLKANKSGYAERNGGRLPFESFFDVRILQDFYLNVGNSRHTLQLSLDIFNFMNLLNKEWGVHRYVTNDNYELIRVNGMEADGTTPEFIYKGSAEREQIWNISDPTSRWRMQFGIRYIFGTPGN